MSRSSWGSTLTCPEQPAPPTAAARADVSQEALRLAELGLLTAGLIHELRQPVFALKALAQLAEGHPARAPEYLAQVLEQARTLEALIEGYADFSRRPAGACEVFELAAPIRSSMVVLEHRAVASQVRLRVDLGAATAVRGSLLAVQQAVVNLGQNAIDALRGQEDGTLSIVVIVEDRVATIRVSDNGPGLPDAIRARLFEPFQTTKPTGTGLGLSISRDLLERAGGALQLVDTEVGTCWDIVLPALPG